MPELTDADITAVLERLDALAAVTASARHHTRTRLFALRQAFYQLGLLGTPPRKGGPVAASPVEHAAAIRQLQIRTEVVRYITTISTTLRATTVAGRTKALRVFFDYLAEHRPAVTRLDQIDRVGHIEPYLAWARRGAGADRTGPARRSGSPSSTKP